MEIKENLSGINSFSFAHWLFGRSLGLVTLIAFLSYWVQADALIGPKGLSPWQTDLENIDAFIESENTEFTKLSIRPTLLWFSPLANHNLIFFIGSVSALLLTLGFLPLLAAFFAWLCYLSLSVVGDPFLSFQWDTLLLETLFLSLPFLPIISIHRLTRPVQYSKWARILILLLLAKLMIESGVVKFTYFDNDGSNAWIAHQALDYHYWTQPLPHPLSSIIHQLPGWFDWLSLNFMYLIEIVLPLCFFLPILYRRIALLGQVILQVSILLSGNYGFFNLLTLTLCIPLIDDKLIPQKLSLFLTKTHKTEISKKSILKTGHLTILYIVFFLLGWNFLKADIKGNRSNSELNTEPNWISPIQSFLRPLRSINSYGLFRVMTKTRPEITIEGSMNGSEWKLYKFKWKPDHAKDELRFAGPHMPRIDWQMWFEGLRAERYVQDPFSKFLYTRFLEIISNGGGQKECFDLRIVLGDEQMRAFSMAPPQQKEMLLLNFQSLMNNFFQQSLWFGKILKSCLDANTIVLNELDNAPFIDKTPKFLRISFHHFQFAQKNELEDTHIWNLTEIPNSQIIINNNSLTSF